MAQDVARNEAVGQFTNMGVGLGTMAGVGGAVGGVVAGSINGALDTTQPADEMADFKTKVEKLSIMKESGLISEEEFRQMKAKLLSDIL